jgi:hypothetical protein
MHEEFATPDVVDLTHRAFAHLNSRDLDAVMGLLSPACVCDMSRWELGVYSGVEAIREFADNWFGTLYEFALVADQIEDFGNGVVYVEQVGHRERAPGGFIELPSAAVALWESGVLMRITVYPDADEARAAAERLAEERG